MPEYFFTVVGIQHVITTKLIPWILILELPECSNKSKARPGPISSENMHDNWKPKVIKYVSKVLNLSKMLVISICLVLLWRDSDMAGLRGVLKKLKWEQSLREKCPNTEYFLVRISPHSDWIRRNTECLSVFSPKAGKCGPKKTPYLGTFHAVSLNQKLIFDLRHIWYIWFIYRYL